jgi:phosphatidylserine decarboxylase
MLSSYAKREWLVVIVVTVLLFVSAALLGWWWALPIPVLVSLPLLWFFRDPPRRVPSQRAVAVAPSDGRVSSIHEVEHFEPFGGPAVCVRIFMSVFDVHVNRVPCHGSVASVTHKPGKHLNTLRPQSAEDNETVTTVFIHPTRHHPVAAVRQVAGLLARTIYNALYEGQVAQRGQRMGIIKLGSTTELYLPISLQPQVQVVKGQRVYGAITVLASVTPLEPRGEATADTTPIMQSA